MDVRATAPAPEFELRNIAAVLRRQVRIIIYTFFMVFGLAAIFLISVTPVYTSSALIFVDPENKNILDPGKATGGNTGTDNARVDSEVEILRSEAVSLAVIASEDLLADAEFAPGQGIGNRLARMVGIAHASTKGADHLVPRTLAKFKESVSVQRRGLTYLISVSVSSRSAARAAELANTMTRTYVNQQVQTKITASLAARDVLQGHIEAARQTVASYENGFDVFIDRTLAETGMQPGQGQITRLRMEIESARAEVLASSDLQDDIDFFLETQDWTSLASAIGDQALAQLDAERNALLEAMAKDQSPASLSETRRELNRIEATLETEATNRLNALDDGLRDLDADATRLRGELREALLSADMSPELLTEIYALQQESTIARTQYQVLLSRMRALETQAHIQIADSRVVSPALAPAFPSFPNRNLVLLAALALATGLGFSLAFLNEYYIGGVTSANQLSDLLQLPTAATIPYSDEQNSGRLSVAEKTVDAPLSAYSESVRKLRAAIDQSLRAKLSSQTTTGVPKGKVILITSALSGEGKTTTALALARTYALAGKRTLLIDGDLRTPALHHHLGFEPQLGFLDYLSNPEKNELCDGFYARDPASPLALILGARRSEIATDQLLTTSTFEDLLEQAREVYDVTIIDSPPLLPVVDARYIAHHADGVVFVVKWAASSQTDLRAAIQPLRMAMNDHATLLPVLAQSEAPRRASRYEERYEGYSAAI